MNCARPSQILNPIWLRRKRFCLGKRGELVWMRSSRPYVQIAPDVLEQVRQMNKGFQSKDTIEQYKKLEAANISCNFFYLTGISGAGRAEIGAKETAKVFNQLHPRIIESSMLTIYQNSELYEEIQKGNSMQNIADSYLFHGL